jgi:hypothetical protein
MAVRAYLKFSTGLFCSLFENAHAISATRGIRVKALSVITYFKVKVGIMISEINLDLPAARMFTGVIE